MTDLHRIMQEGVPDPEPPKKLPSIMPWALVALVLVLISLGIRLFWPVPGSQPLPQCSDQVQTQEACVRKAPQSDSASH
ncbi:hypothetical protein ABHV46_12315 [Asaia sp. BMEF1]|uniref:hypothetical protein n=1 Tax=Asaia sp. BMEF1 TaxID=3155932 RepID=UPI003F672AFC